MIRLVCASAMLICASGMLSCLATPSYAEEERGVVLLTDNVWADGARQSIKGRAMVCNLKADDSFLSLRTEPDSNATEITKLNEMTIVELTGETQAKWANVREIVFEVSRDGQIMPEENHGVLTISGWVHTDYLCNYLY